MQIFYIIPFLVPIPSIGRAFFTVVLRVVAPLPSHQTAGSVTFVHFKVASTSGLPERSILIRYGDLCIMKLLRAAVVAGLLGFYSTAAGHVIPSTGSCVIM